LNSVDLPTLGRPTIARVGTLDIVRLIISGMDHNEHSDNAGNATSKLWRKFVGVIPADDLKLMAEAIERDCELVEPFAEPM
jgi:hypothetical protein